MKGREFVQIICESNICTGCGACAAICPKGCIHMEADAEGFLYPRIDTDACIGCGLCERTCPVSAEKPADSLKQAYAAYHKNPDVRQSSSSGGIFTAIAQYVIQKNGVVFGARLDQSMRVVHGYTDTVEGLSDFRGSKYVQSEIGDTYHQAEAFLKQGRLVLFSGTPCQIGGLKAYLGKSYGNLICQDIICHGVPAPLAWKKYLEDQQRIFGGKPVAAFFRDKTFGWSNFSMSIRFSNGKSYLCSMKQDSFMKAFLMNYCLRDSCYQCAFKQEARQADITLADFWGINRIAPEMNDDRGTSLVLIHTEQGKTLFDEVCDTLKSMPVGWKASIDMNSAMYASVARPPRRDRFMKDLQKKHFMPTVKRYCRQPVSEVLRKHKESIRYLPNRVLRKLLGPEKYDNLRSAIKGK